MSQVEQDCENAAMGANRILNFLMGILAFLVAPIQIVTTSVLGILVELTLGLLLLPISLVWSALLFPMVGLSWLCDRVPVVRNVVGILFIPWALIADTFVALMPSMGEMESRASKLMLCNAWPFTWEFWQFLSGRLDLKVADSRSIALNEVIERMSHSDPLMKRVVVRVCNGEQLDTSEAS